MTRKKELKICIGCGESYTTRSLYYCSRECYDNTRHKMRGHFNKAVGQVSRTTDGYMRVILPDHPDAHPSDGRIMQHRLVMEGMIGRRLLPSEEVHHKNLNRSDNDPSNLELWSKSQPAGARVIDLLEYADRIIALYRPIEDKLKEQTDGIAVR